MAGVEAAIMTAAQKSLEKAKKLKGDSLTRFLQANPAIALALARSDPDDYAEKTTKDEADPAKPAKSLESFIPVYEQAMKMHAVQCQRYHNNLVPYAVITDYSFVGTDPAHFNYALIAEKLKAAHMAVENAGVFLKQQHFNMWGIAAHMMDVIAMKGQQEKQPDVWKKLGEELQKIDQFGEMKAHVSYKWAQKNIKAHDFCKQYPGWLISAGETSWNFIVQNLPSIKKMFEQKPEHAKLMSDFDGKKELPFQFYNPNDDTYQAKPMQISALQGHAAAEHACRSILREVQTVEASDYVELMAESWSKVLERGKWTWARLLTDWKDSLMPCVDSIKHLQNWRAKTGKPLFPIPHEVMQLAEAYDREIEAVPELKAEPVAPGTPMQGVSV